MHSLRFIMCEYFAVVEWMQWMYKLYFSAMSMNAVKHDSPTSFEIINHFIEAYIADMFETFLSL